VLFPKELVLWTIVATAIDAGALYFLTTKLKKVADCLGSDNVNNDIIAPRLAIE
jgi:hypothetical protein